MTISAYIGGTPARVPRVATDWRTDPHEVIAAEKTLRETGAPEIFFDPTSSNHKPIRLTPGSRRAQKLASPVTLLADYPLLQSMRFYENLAAANLPVDITLRQSYPDLAPEYFGPCGRTTPQVHGEVTLLRVAGPRNKAIFRCTVRGRPIADHLMTAAAITIEFNPPGGHAASLRTRLVAAMGSLPGMRAQLMELADFTGGPYPLAQFCEAAKALKEGWTEAAYAGGAGSDEANVYNKWRYSAEHSAADPVVQRSWILPELSTRRPLRAALKAG